VSLNHSKNYDQAIKTCEKNFISVITKVAFERDLSREFLSKEVAKFAITEKFIKYFVVT
jgi:hypothetical protein